jgi:hypothetical protein
MRMQKLQYRDAVVGKTWILRNRTPLPKILGGTPERSLHRVSDYYKTCKKWPCLGKQVLLKAGSVSGTFFSEKITKMLKKNIYIFQKKNTR